MHHLICSERSSLLRTVRQLPFVFNLKVVFEKVYVYIYMSQSFCTKNKCLSDWTWVCVIVFLSLYKLNKNKSNKHVQTFSYSVIALKREKLRKQSQVNNFFFLLTPYVYILYYTINIRINILQPLFLILTVYFFLLLFLQNQTLSDLLISESTCTSFSAKQLSNT